MSIPRAIQVMARPAAVLVLLASAVPGAVHAFFTIDSPIAVVAEDPHVAARLQEALRRRFRNLHHYPALPAAQEAARGSESGPVVALLVSSATSQGSADAYGTALTSCHVQVTVQVLRLPEGAFEYSASADARAPDCGKALGEASARISDELVKSLEGYRRQGVPREKVYLWLELADVWSEAELETLITSLTGIPGIRKVDRDAEGRELRLEVYREARALARDVDRLASVKLTRFAGDRMSLVHADPARVRARAEPSAAPSPRQTKEAESATPLPALPRAARIPQATGRKWALVVGISTFQDPSVPSLSFPVKDAQAFAEALQDSSVGRFAPGNVLVLLDREATTRRIKMELDRLARMTKPEDLFLFYFSSHAVPGIHDTAGDAYLVTHDTEKMNLYATGLPMRELVDALTSRIRAQTVVSFLDACNTGQIVDRSEPIFKGAKAVEYEPGPASPPAAAPSLSWSREWKALAKSSAPETVARPPDHREDESQPAKRVVFISSSDGDQPSWESETLGHGYFTYYLMDILRRSQGQVTVKSIFEYLKSEVKRAVAIERGAVQEPRMFVTHDADILLGYSFERDNR